MGKHPFRCAVVLAVVSGALLSFAFADDTAQAAKQKPLNVLLIMSDDMRA